MNSEIENSNNQVDSEKKDQSYQNWSDRKTDKKNAPDEYKENNYEKEIEDEDEGSFDSCPEYSNSH